MCLLHVRNRMLTTADTDRCCKLQDHAGNVSILRERVEKSSKHFLQAYRLHSVYRLSRQSQCYHLATIVANFRQPLASMLNPN